MEAKVHGEPFIYKNLIHATTTKQTINNGGGEIAEGTQVILAEAYSLEEPESSFAVINVDNTPFGNELGVEDFIEKEIQRGWNALGVRISIVPNREYIKTNVLSHTKKQVVLDTDNDSYNLHTFMTNATQWYGITYSFRIVEDTIYHVWNLFIDIENEQEDKQLIDTNAMNVSQYEEVFNTDIVAKVYCGTKTYDYRLFLKTDRTTTTDSSDPDLADGKTEVIYTDNYENAYQECLNVIQKNQYNHNISFTYDKYIPVGTPIAIKTKNQAIENTYISSIKFSKNKFYQYECGNIRMNFIDKLLKERN